MVSLVHEEDVLSAIPGVVVQDVTTGSSKEGLDLSSFCSLKAMTRLKLRSIAGSLRMENFGQALNSFTARFSESVRILVCSQNAHLFLLISVYFYLFLFMFNLIKGVPVYK
jgi:hypothetical protein